MLLHEPDDGGSNLTSFMTSLELLQNPKVYFGTFLARVAFVRQSLSVIPAL